MRSTILCALMLCASIGLLGAQDMTSVRSADAFQLPVGENGSGEGYYVARGYRPNGHLGEDWNGTKGGDTDLGDPVYAIANGLVVFAKNYHVGWGNVVIIRHAYYEGSDLKYVDSLYGHLLEFTVEEGQQVRRGQKIGRIGNNNGMYDAHLHLEMRKNLAIGMYRSSFARDFSNYYSASDFIAAHRICPKGNRSVSVPINTFPASAPPSYAAGPKVYTPMFAPGNAPENPAIAALSGGPVPQHRLFVPPPEALAKPPPPTPPPVVAKATPTPTPPPTPEPKAVTKRSTPKPVETPEPPVKVTAKVSSSPKATPKASPTPKSAVAKATPLPAPIAKAPPTEKPTPAQKTAKASPAPSKTVSKSPESTPPAVPSASPSILDSVTPDGPTVIAPSGPIRRGSGSFRVDRFEDLRGKSY